MSDSGLAPEVNRVILTKRTVNWGVSFLKGKKSLGDFCKKVNTEAWEECWKKTYVKLVEWHRIESPE